MNTKSNSRIGGTNTKRTGSFTCAFASPAKSADGLSGGGGGGAWTTGGMMVDSKPSQSPRPNLREQSDADAVGEWVLVRAYAHASCQGAG